MSDVGYQMQQMDPEGTYTLQSLMKRMMDNVPPPRQANPSYMSDFLEGAGSSEGVDYSQYQPQGIYSLADRLAAAQQAGPEGRELALQATAPMYPKMKTGLRAFGEAVSPMLKAGTKHANAKKDLYKETEAKDFAAHAEIQRNVAKTLVEIEMKRLKEKNKGDLEVYKQHMQNQRDSEKQESKERIAHEKIASKSFDPFSNIKEFGGIPYTMREGQLTPLGGFKNEKKSPENLAAYKLHQKVAAQEPMGLLQGLNPFGKGVTQRDKDKSLYIMKAMNQGMSDVEALEAYEAGMPLEGNKKEKPFKSLVDSYDNGKQAIIQKLLSERQKALRE